MRPRFVAGWANLRSAVFALPYGDQTLLISRDYYHEIGGYPQISLMEDVAIAGKIGRNYTRLEFNAITRADKFITEGWLKRGTKNLATLVLYFIGRDVENWHVGIKTNPNSSHSKNPATRTKTRPLFWWVFAGIVFHRL